MPTYEYKCAACGSVFELKQRFSDEPLTTHEGCGGTVERIIFAPALQFKGSGWYVTDYAKSGGSSKDSVSKDPGAKDAGKDSSGKESASKDTKATDSTSTTKSEAKSDTATSTPSTTETKK